MKGGLFGGSGESALDKKRASLGVLDEAVVLPDFGCDEAASPMKGGASEAGVEVRQGDGGGGGGENNKAKPVSIRDDANFQRHAKKQGHSTTRSAMAMSGHGRLEGDEVDGGSSVGGGGGGEEKKRVGIRSCSVTAIMMRSSSHSAPQSGSVDGGGKRSSATTNLKRSSSGGADPVEPPRHAKRQGHKSTFSVANVFSAAGGSHHTRSGHTRSGLVTDESNDQGHADDGGVGNMNDTGHGSSGPYGGSVVGGEGFGGPEKDWTIEEDEMYARDNAESRLVPLWFWNGLSSVLVFVRYLISVDSMLSLFLSCGLTYWSWSITKDDDYFDGTMSFILLGFAVLMPLSVSVRITFSRREKALENISSLQTHAQHIYLCHACWDWGKAPGGRSADPNRWLKHSDEVLDVLVAIGDELTRFLTLPNSSFSRHRETKPGRREAAVTIGASYRIFGDVIDRRMNRLAMLLEKLKLGGFSASEASRVRQYEKLLTQSAQNLRMLKMYRSPKALNALLNLTTTLLPPFYAPAFAQIAHDSGSLGMGIAFAAITSLALSALYESVQVLEDPFVAFLTLDGIDVYEELAVLYYHQLIETRREIFPNAHMFNEEVGEKDTLSEIFELEAVDESSPSPAPVMDRRAMMTANKSQKSSMRVSGSQRNRSITRRQSAYKLDLPPELNRGRRRSSAASIGSGLRESINSGADSR